MRKIQSKFLAAFLFSFRFFRQVFIHVRPFPLVIERWVQWLTPDMTNCKHSLPIEIHSNSMWDLSTFLCRWIIDQRRKVHSIDIITWISSVGCKELFYVDIRLISYINHKLLSKEKQLKTDQPTANIMRTEKWRKK